MARIRAIAEMLVSRRRPARLTDVLTPTPQITCIDCGGRCFLLSHPPEDGIWEPGDVIAYRCEDCLDRWDIVMSDEDDAEIARGD